MATARANLETTISADMSQFSATMRKAGMLAGQTAGKIGASMKSTAVSIGKMGAAAAAAGAALAGAAAAATALKGLKLAASMESTAVAFETLLGSADSAKTVLADLKKLGAETPFEFPELADAGRKLIAFGESGGTVASTLRRIGDVSAGVQAPISEIAEIYGKARVQGRLFAEDINQLTGRGIPIIGELAKQFGVTEGAVKGFVEDGKVGFPELEKAFIALTSAGGKFYGMMEKQSQTTLGLTSTLKDTFNEALTAFGQPINDAIRPLLEDAIALAGELAPLAARLGEAFAGMVKDVDLRGAVASTGEMLDNAYQFGQRLTNAIEAAGVLLRATFSGEFWVAQGKLIVAAMGDGVNTLVAGVRAANAMLLQIFAEMPNLVWSAWKFLTDPSFWESVKNSLLNVAMTFASSLVGFLSKAFELLKNMDFKGLKDLGGKIAEEISGGGKKKDFTFSVGDSVRDSMNRILDAGKKAFSGSDPLFDTAGLKEDATAVFAEIGKEWTDILNRPIKTLPDAVRKFVAKARADDTNKGKSPIQTKAEEYASAGFGGLASLYQMQSDKASGISPGETNIFAKDRTRLGIATASQTGGLGEKRRLKTSAESKEAKKQLSLAETQTEHLQSIKDKISDSLKVA